MRFLTLKFTFFATLFIYSFTACDDSRSSRFDFSDVPLPFDTLGLERTFIADDFYYMDQRIGKGLMVNERELVSIYFTLWDENGTAVASSYVNSNFAPVEIRFANPINLGRYGINVNTDDFSGMRRGMKGMREGGRRTIVIPLSESPRFSGLAIFRGSITLDVELTSLLD